MSQESIGNFLQRLQGKMLGLKEAREKYASRFSPAFNVLEVLRPDEMRLSEILAELLNPRGRHAQGLLFWNLFSRKFNLNAVISDPSQVEVMTEYATTGLEGREYRRIDILAKIDRNRAFAIENKPWANDQAQQIADYLDYLQVNYKEEYALVYLSGDGSPPGEHSINAEKSEEAMRNGHLRIIAYGELIPWLEECKVRCTAPRVSDFLQEFVEYVKSEFLGIRDMTERDAVIQAALESDATISAAMEIIRAGTDIREALCQTLKNDVLKGLAADEQLARTVYLNHKENEPWWKKWVGLTFFLGAETGRYSLRFAFDTDNFGEFYFGIRNGTDAQMAEADIPEIRKALDKEFGVSGQKNEWWTWWLYFDAPLRDWHSDNAPWLQIKNGELAKMILKKVRDVYRALDDRALIERLR